MNCHLSFPEPSAEQVDQLRELQQLALRLNKKINLYSEASTGSFWKRHIEHSLTLAIHSFPAGAAVVDWGTGGGMPGLPLAIMFPNVAFHLVDAVGKKVMAVQMMARRLGLNNVHSWHSRAEEWQGEASHSVSRATAPLATLWGWHGRIHTPIQNHSAEEWKPGLICLKGGDLAHEIESLRRRCPDLEIETIPLEPLSDGFELEEKMIVVVSE